MSKGGLKRRILQNASYIAYRYVVSTVPSRFRWWKRVRVAFLRGSGCKVHWTANINAHAMIDRSCEIAEHAGVGEGCWLAGEVHLGPHVTMGPGCWFLTGVHPVPGDRERFRDRSSEHRPIFVGEDVFIGARAVILAGVHIGPGAAVGAGSVVAKDVEAGSTVVGNPAREVRRRQPPEPLG